MGLKTAVLPSIRLFVLISLAAGAGDAAAQDGAPFRIDELHIETAGARHRVLVEVAETPAQRGQGLMWRRDLAPGTGMLFDFKTVDNVIMWMKNTYVALDMLFIAADGRIIKIARDTTPLSTALIASGGPVLGVLELRAGAARQLGIRAGDRVSHPLFGG